MISYKNLKVDEVYTVQRKNGDVHRKIKKIEPGTIRGTVVWFVEGTNGWGPDVIDDSKPMRMGQTTAKSFCKWLRRKA